MIISRDALNYIYMQPDITNVTDIYRDVPKSNINVAQGFLRGEINTCYIIH